MAVREKSGGYSVLADLWPDFVGRRWEGAYGEFAEGELRRHGCRRVLNASLGDGCDTLQLLKRGFLVESNEIDENFVEAAERNAEREGVCLEVSRLDWRSFSERMPASEFDAVVLLGNSLTHLFEKGDRLQALSGFFHVLKPGGILLIDERDYGQLRGRARGMPLPRNSTYRGESVTVAPEAVEESKIVLRYTHSDGRTASLELYPFRKGELEAELAEAGFVVVEKLFDHCPNEKGETQFIQYVAMKPFQNLY